MADAEKVLENGGQLLDGSQEDQPLPIRAVHLHCEHKIDIRVVRRALNFYEMETCERIGDSRTDFIVVFKNAAGRTSVKLVANGYMFNRIAVLVPLLNKRCVSTIVNSALTCGSIPLVRQNQFLFILLLH